MALRQARRTIRSRPARVRICWDLDNTLVGSGRLLRAGGRLEQAVVEAGPVPNMLAFHEALRQRIPSAEHFILTARRRSMRRDTLAWLERHGLTTPGDSVWLVPDAASKPRIWSQLATGAQLVIVDDLSYEHESEEPKIHRDLVELAAATAVVHVGFEEIAQIEADTAAVERIADRTAEALRGRPRD